MTKPAATSVDPAAICTLSPAELERRLGWIRSEILPHAIETRALDGGLALELIKAPGLADKLDLLIELESDCCSQIGFARVEAAAPDRLRLEVRGIDPEAEGVRWLREPAANHAPPDRER